MPNEKSYKEVWGKDVAVGKRSDIGWMMGDFHTHDNFEIYVTMTDNVKIYVNNRVYNAKKGTVAVYNSEDMHRIEPPSDVEYVRYVLDFRPEYIGVFSEPETDLLDCFLNRSSDFVHVVNLDDNQQKHLVQLLERIIYYRDNPGYGSNLQIKISLVEILLVLNPLYSTIVADNKDQRIKPIIRYIRSNLHRQMTVKELADKAYLSSRHLEQLFKNATGTSVNKYIIYHRILKSKELLRENMQVKQVAVSCGFNSTTHFIRTFKKVTGTTPKQYKH